MAGALDGLIVLDLSRGSAGAIAGMFMADHGARVVRVISDDNQILRGGGFRVWDRGKEIVRCSLDDATDAFCDCVKTADVLIEDYAPSARPVFLQSLQLKSLNHRLITCSITAYGEHGSLSDEPPIDDLVLARTGVLSGLPGFRGAPVHCAHPLPSTGAGVMAALGIAAALLSRQSTGYGRHVATSLVAGALLYHPKVVAEKLQPHIFQTNPYGSAPFYSVYRCSDDEWIQLGCVHPGFIARAAKLMGIGELLDDPIYGKGHAPATPEADIHLRDLVGKVMITRSATDWSTAFETNDIPFARARTTEEGLDDLQIAHNNMVVSLDDPEVGAMDQMGVPVKLSVTPGGATRPRTTKVSGCIGLNDVAGITEPTATTIEENRQQSLPLAGIRVLEITNLIAGPMAGRLLADLGADVMKLEPPTGDISRPIGRTYFYSVNYAKRSIAVDTAKPAGKAIVAKLASTCDVILANLRPGATQRMGIGHDIDPQVIETQISGYGLSGPYAHRPGIDPLAQALMGLERAQGGTGNPPSFPAQLAPTDFTTGAMAAFGTVLALYARSSGAADGQRVEVNLLDGAIMLSSEWFTRHKLRESRPLADSGQFGPSPYHRLYQLTDGFVYIAADTASEQAALRLVLGLSNEPEQVDQIANHHPLDSPYAKEMAEKLIRLSFIQVSDLLRETNVPFAPVADAESSAFFDASYAVANDWAATRDHIIAGDLTAVARYIKFDGSPKQKIPPTPLLGEHSGAILQEAGFTTDQINQLLADALVMSEPSP